MVTEIEYALMAGRAYQSTRSEINLFPTPVGWLEPLDKRERDDSTGFEAGYFQRGTEIVISYAGTNPDESIFPLGPDYAANVGLATGFGSDQLVQAVEYYLQVKAANPTSTITLTGHSLGGGLAALVGVFFGVQAVTFDQAPFANSATPSLVPPDVAAGLKATLLQKGHTEVELAPLTDYIERRAVAGGIPNSGLVTGISVAGELLLDLPFTAVDKIGLWTTIDNNAPGVSGLDLHSHGLLTAFLQSKQTALPQQALNDVTFKLPDLLRMIFDENLYERDTNDPNNQNFLERLIQHEAGIGTTVPADRMVTRFTNDLWKLAQEGGMTMHEATTIFGPLNEVSKTLIAFAMQKYYEETQTSAGYNKELFTDLASAGIGSGGLHFDRRDVALSLSLAKGDDLYFQNYVNSPAFTSSERQLIQSILPKLRDWYVQAGMGGMRVTDSLSRGAFLLGGMGMDTMTGGSGSDLLVGNAGNDTLNGRAGADILLGGSGDDRYMVDHVGDVVMEVPNSGIDTVTSSVSFALGANVEQLTLTGTADLNGKGNELDNTITGNGGTNRLTGLGGTDHLIGGDKNDTLIGGTGDDRLEGGAGFDTYYYNNGDGTDQIEDSDAKGRIIFNGRLLVGGVNNANDPANTYRSQDGGFTYVLAGGHLIVNGVLTVNADFESGQFGIELFEGPDIPSYENGLQTQRYYVETGFTPDGQITNSTNVILFGSDLSDDLGQFLSSYRENDQIFGYGGSDFMAAGLGHDRVYGGDGNDRILGGIYFVTQWPELFTDSIDSLDGDDYLDGENGNDSIAGLAGNDRLFGGDGTDTLMGDGDPVVGFYFSPSAGNDSLDGGAGDDWLYGDYGADVLSGGDGNDLLQGDYILHRRHATGGEPVGTVFPVPFDRARAQDDFLDGGAGNDQLYGDGGHDTLVGGVGNDQLYGDYNEIFFFGDSWTDEDLRNVSGDDVLDGGDGDDLVYGMGGDDVLAGGEGIDQLYGSDGADEIYGGAGDDFISGDFLDNVAPGDDLLYGDGGADFLLGAAGNDLLDGGDGDDALQGGIGEDLLFGGIGKDLLFGQEGDDLLFGDDGIDSLSGGVGNDTIYGDEGNDTLLGDEGNDTLFGGVGDDGLRGGVGDDVLNGGAGDDVYVFHLGDGHDVISDGTGSQVFNELVFGPGISLGSLTFVHNPVLQSLTIQINGGGDSVELLGVDLNNVAGTTPVKLLGFSDGSQFALADQLPLASGLIEGDEGDEIIRTGSGDDVVDAQAGNDRVFAGAGHDFVIGGSGIDVLFGEAGDDRLIGGIGSDQLFGGSGNDTVEGAAGYDYVEGGEGNDSIYGGTEDDFLFGDHNPNTAPPSIPVPIGGDDFLQGEDGNDDLRGGVGNDTLLGGLGDDLLFGEDGDDTLDGGSGDDLRLDGGPGIDVIRGGEGNDRLFAGFRSRGGEGEGDGDGIFVAPSSPSSGVDQLFGDDGDDYLDSGYENLQTDDSILAGGSGNDAYVVDSTADIVMESANSGIDTIESFVSYTLPDNVENLVIAGVTGVLGTGNTLDNVMRGFGQGTLDGRAGNDTLIDAQAYLFGRGGGQDTIVENDTSSAPYFPGGAQDTIRMPAGVTPADITWQRIGNDLILKINGATDQVAIPSYYNVVFNQGDYRFSPNLYFLGTNINVSTLPYYVAPSQIEVVQFADGTIWGPGAFDAIQLGSFYPNGYTFGRGDGQDTIVDFDFTLEQPIDILQMTVGVSLNDVTFHRAGDDLVLGITGTTDQLTVRSHFASVFVLPPFAATGRTVKAYQLDQIRFADGTVMEPPVIGTDQNDFIQGTSNDNVILGLGGEDTLQGLLGNDRIEGGAGNDYLEGNEGNDTLDGGGGTDTLIGGAGHDTYLFNLGDGIDTIADAAMVGEGNRIRFGTGIANTDLTFAHDQVARTLTILVGGGGADKLVLTGFDPAGTNGSLVVSALEFANGNVVNLVDLYPANQTSTLAAPLADQTVPEGVPLFIQVPANTFIDPDAGDVLTLSASLADGTSLPAWISFDTATRTFTGTPDDAQVGSLDLMVTATDHRNESASDTFTLTVTNVNEAPTVAAPLANQTTLEDAPFTFTLPTSTFTDVDQVHGDSLAYSASVAGGGTLPTWLSFDITTRTLSGMPGNNDVGTVALTATATDADNLNVSTGFTLTVQNVNDAPTVAIPVADQNAAEDSLFSLTIPGTTFTDPDLIHGDGLTYSATLADGSALPTWLNFNPTTRALRGAPGPGDAGTLQIAIAATDTSNLSATDLFTLAISGPLPQTLVGTPGNDVLTGGRGDDILTGLAGNDTLTGGQGHDLLDGGTGTDTMQGNLGNDTYIVDMAGDVVTELASEGTDTVQSSITYTLGSNVEHLTLTGSSNLNGTGNGLDNILTGNSGANVLTGRAGNDTYIVSAGDTVVENAGGGTDTVQSTVTWILSLNVENLTLTGTANINGIGSSGNNVLIGNSGNNILAGGFGNDTMVGGEGNDSLLGGSGNDQLVGELGDDTLIGGAGNDTLTGSGGNDVLIGGADDDVYYFSRGDGQDAILDLDLFPYNRDQALFGTTINPLDLVLSRQANDLRLAIHGSTDAVTVKDWYLSNNNRIETVQAGNGDVLISTQVDQLIQAMAAFSQQTGLSWDQALDQRPQEVEAILAGSWQ